MTQQTKLVLDDERHNLWYAATRGLYGIIRILERYMLGWTDQAPTSELRKAADRLHKLCDDIESRNLTDPNNPTFDFSA